MWTCDNCSESVEASFAVCWKCGTSMDGERDLNFVAEPHDELPRTLESEIEDSFKCAKCSHATPHIKRISASGSGVSRLMNIQHNQFLVVSCSNCAYSEMYDADILGARQGVGNLLDFLFG